MGAVRRRLEFTLAARTKTIRLHKFANALLRRPNAARLKFSPDAWPAIGALHLAEQRLDVNQQRHIAEPTAGLKGADVRLARSISPIDASADLQHPALRRYRPKLSMLRDEGVFHRDSLAKYAAAFFRMSHSIRALASSAFRRAISISSAPIALLATSRGRPPPRPSTSWQRLVRKPQGLGRRSDTLASLDKTDGLLLEFRRVSRPSYSCHANPSNADPTQSALADVLQRQDHSATSGIMSYAPLEIFIFFCWSLAMCANCCVMSRALQGIRIP